VDLGSSFAVYQVTNVKFSGLFAPPLMAGHLPLQPLKSAEPRQDGRRLVPRQLFDQAVTQIRDQR
jgi:hypothetical protein